MYSVHINDVLRDSPFTGASYLVYLKKDDVLSVNGVAGLPAPVGGIYELTIDGNKDLKVRKI